MRLELNQEVSGWLSEIYIESKNSRLTFNIDQEFEIPFSAVSVENHQNLIKTYVGFLNIDGQFFFT